MRCLSSSPVAARLSRRQVLHGTAGAAAGLLLGVGCRAHAAPAIKILGTKIISRQPELYHGWPTLARRRNGQLLVSCSGGREGHICPFGRVELIRSSDDGQTWSPPQLVVDTPLDDRDSGVLETQAGTLLVTTFTSLAYESILAKAEAVKPGQQGAWDLQRLARWKAARDALSPEERRRRLGVWVMRSSDGGQSWSPPADSLVNSPHGPIQLADGRLLYAGKDLWRRGAWVGVCESADDGQTWRRLAAIAPRPGDSTAQYHELHAVETSDGRLVVQIRNHNQANAGETLQCESSDGGRSWSEPHAIGVWGLPSHLLRLRDGRLLMTYGHRRPPYGNQARFSSDGGRTWSEPVIISGDGAGGDLGYPSTVELADGSLLSVWYESMRTTPGAVLRQARWVV